MLKNKNKGMKLIIRPLQMTILLHMTHMKMEVERRVSVKLVIISGHMVKLKQILRQALMIRISNETREGEYKLKEFNLQVPAISINTRPPFTIKNTLLLLGKSLSFFNIE